MAGMSLAFFRQVMALPLNPKDRNFGKVLGVKQQAAQAVMTIMARVDAGRLRDTPDDGLADLLAQLDGEGKSAPVADPLDEIFSS